MLQRWRGLYEKTSIPFGKASLKLRLSPDFWTLFSVFVALVAAALIALGHFWWGLVMVWGMNVADMLDGATARAGGTGTRFGTVLDHVCDRYAEFLLIGGFAAGHCISPELALFAASGIVMASYVRSKAESAGGLNNCNVGLAGRQEKLILMWVALAFFGFDLVLYGQIAIALIGIISHITALQRLLYARKQILQH
jgi:phosphatidylglycerophosphate synthase